MSSLGIVLVLLVALVVIKPERLPEIIYLIARLFVKIKTTYQKILYELQNL